ncbi:MAG: HD domain-containing protein [Bryobacteraceae bacterium]
MPLSQFLELLNNHPGEGAGGLLALAAAVNHKESLTIPHSIRAFLLAEQMALAVGLTDEHWVALRLGGLLHDIGKLVLPNWLLLKDSELGPADWQIMQRHPMSGCRLLASYHLPRLAMDVVEHHHERFDGRGYPGGLQGKQIPYLARLFAIADSFDAMTSARPYRRPFSLEEAAQQIHLGAGTQFDPELAELFASRPVAEWLCFKSGQKEMPGRNYHIS